MGKGRPRQYINTVGVNGGTSNYVQWGLRNPENAKQAQVKYASSLKGKLKAITRTLSLYNLEYEDWIDLQIKQNFVCLICKRPEHHKNRRNLSVDHDHKTLKVRGLLCHSCNLGISMFFENPFLLNEAIGYVKKYV